MAKLAVVPGIAIGLAAVSCGPAQRVVPDKLAPRVIEVPVSSLQFDLECRFERQFDRHDTEHPDARPYRPPVRRTYVSRKIVDLERMVYCWTTSCGGSKHTPIEAVTSEGILFTSYPDLVQFYRWDSGLTESRATYAGRTSIQQGQCRIEPFSGFPPPGPPRVFLREREGSGPHPFRHEGIHPDDEIVGPVPADREAGTFK